MKVKEFTFDFNLTAWVRNLVVEAESEEAAKEILLSMSIEEIMENSSIKDFDITDLDIESKSAPGDAFEVLAELEDAEETYFSEHGELSDIATDFKLFREYMLERDVESYEDIDVAWDAFLDFCSELV